MSNSRKIIKRIAKTIVWFVAVIVLIIALLIGTFYIFRNKIHDELIGEMNKTLPGEVIVEKIHFAPFKFYPYYLAFRLENPKVYEHKMDIIDTSAIPVMGFKNAYVGLHFKYLRQKKIKIAGIAARDGFINITINEDTTMNLLYAFGKYKLHRKKRKVLEKLDIVEVFNVDMTHRNKLTNKLTEVHINNLTDYYNERGDTVYATVNGNIHLDSYSVDNKKILKNKTIDLDLDFHWNMVTLQGTLDTGKISVGKASLNLWGNFNMNKPFSYEFNISAEKKGLSTINLDDPETFLSEDGTGRIIFNGELEGSTSQKIPNADISFRVIDLNIEDPKTDSHIRGLNFSGHFSTGDSSDLSLAELKVDHLRAIVSGDSVNGSVHIRDFTKPYVIADIRARIDLKNLEKDLNIDQINNLEGILMVKANLDGVIDFKNDQILKDAGNIRVRFQGVSFGIPETKHIIENATADILVQEEKILITNLSFKSGNNDIEIQGDITNLIYELSGHDRPIEANFKLNADRLNLKELLSFDTTLAKKFNEIIEDLSLDIKIKTTTTSLNDLKSFPEGEIVIQSFTTNFQTLPDIKDISGIIVVDEESISDPNTATKINKKHIEIKDFKIITGRSDLQISGNIHTEQYTGIQKKSPASVELSIKSEKLYPKELLEFDTILAKTYEDEISNLILNLKYDTFLEDIENKWYLPVGTLTLESLSADFEQKWNIKNITGKLNIVKDTVRITNFIGVMGESDLEFSGYINNYPGLFRTDTAIHVEIGFYAYSDLMRAQDFFTRKGQFYLPPKFKEEYLKDFKLVADYQFLNHDYFSNTMLPDMQLEISDLRWKTSNTLLDYRDFHIKLIRTGKDLSIEDFKGKIGSSDFNFNAEIQNFEPFKDPDFKNLSAQFVIEASVLDLNELTDIRLPKSGKHKSKNSKFNPFDFLYHDLTFDMNVDHLYYDDFIIHNFACNALLIFC